MSVIISMERLKENRQVRFYPPVTHVSGTSFVSSRRNSTASLKRTLKAVITGLGKKAADWNPMTLEEKWEWVKTYYERAYKVKFHSRLKDKDVLDLYKKMRKLQKEIHEYEEQKLPPSFR